MSLVELSLRQTSPTLLLTKCKLDDEPEHDNDYDGADGVLHCEYGHVRVEAVYIWVCSVWERGVER